MQTILSNLMGLKVADAFLEPVDWKNWGLFDYPQIVKKPMDLSTMEAKLKANKYASFADFKADLELIVDNCMLFNEKSSDVYRQAVSLRKAIAKEVGKLGSDKPSSGRKSSAAPTPATPAASAQTPAASAKTTAAVSVPVSQARAPAQPTFKLPNMDEKDRFCRNLFALNATELGKVMELVDEICPNAIETVGGDEVDLNVDSIDGAAFKRVDAFVKDLHKKLKLSAPAAAVAADQQ